MRKISSLRVLPLFLFWAIGPVHDAPAAEISPEFLEGLGGGLAGEWEKRVDGMPPLMRAAYYDDVGGVRLALRSGARVDETYRNERYTALMWAAANAGPEVVAALLEAGADVNARDNFGDTPIMWAAGGNASSLAHMFGAFGGSSPAVAWLLRSRNGNPNAGAVIPLLIRHGARTDGSAGHGKTPLEWATEQGNQAAIAALAGTSGAAAPAPAAMGEWARKPGAARLLSKLELVRLRPLTADEAAYWEEVFTTAPPLVGAILDDDPALAARLVAEGHNVNRKHMDTPPLSWAAYNAGPEMVRLLLDAGAEIGEKDDRGATPLARACGWSDDVEVVRILLQYGAPVDARDDDGANPAKWAALTSRRPVEVLSLLCDFGFNFRFILDEREAYKEAARLNPAGGREVENAIDRLTDNPSPTRRLADALANADVDVGAVRELLALGADPNGRGWVARSCLQQVLEWDDSPKKREVFTALVDAGADPRIAGHEGSHLFQANTICRDDQFAFLLENNIDPNYVDRRNRAAMHNICRFGPAERIERALLHGGDIHVRNRDGHTPLMWSAFDRLAKHVALLVEKGARTEDRSNAGWTALMCAARTGAEKPARDLLAGGADVGAVDNAGNTALHHASFIASGEDHRPAVEALLEAGADVERKNGEGNTPLMNAVLHNRPQVVRALAATGRALDTTDENGCTPVEIAVFGDSDPAILVSLIRAGADLDKPGFEGVPPILRAARRSTPEKLLLLAAGGADLQAVDGDGANALAWAALGDSCPETIEWLAAEGVDVNQVDAEGMTPLLRAAAANLRTPKTIIPALARAGARVYDNDMENLKQALELARERENAGAVEILQAMEQNRYEYPQGEQRMYRSPRPSPPGI